MTATFDSPSPVIARLEEIDRDLSARQNLLETSAMAWFKAKREREKMWATEFIRAQGPVEARKAEATLRTVGIGLQEEAEYESLKAVMRTLETRASIGQSILKAQSRV